MGIGVWELLLILLIIVLLFGTKKLKNIGSDLGGAINSFRNSMRESDKDEKNDSSVATTTATTARGPVISEDKGSIIEGQVTDRQVNKV